MKIQYWTCVMIASALCGIGQAASAAEMDAASVRKGGVGPAMIPPSTGNPTTERTTDEELLNKRAESSSTPAEFKPTPTKPSDFGLLQMSNILEYNGNFALLPKGAILFCPEGYRTRYVTRPASRCTPWMDFFAMNRNWITTREVTEAEISGEKPITAETLEAFKKANLVVIATQYGNPITVLPPVVKPTANR